jgi:DNA-binding MarR family transcriptional regulator
MYGLDPKNSDRIQKVRSYIHSEMKDLMGLDDTGGIEVLSLIRMLMSLFEMAESQDQCKVELSGPRWGLLLRLMAEEKLGNQGGITPTSLSRFQGVSKNAISSLLRGLEEQGYIQRTLDPVDYRIFHIQLTPAGRELVTSTAPKRLAYLNQLVSGLSEEEREQMITLLMKLYRSVVVRSNLSELPVHGG